MVSTSGTSLAELADSGVWSQESDLLLATLNRLSVLPGNRRSSKPRVGQLHRTTHDGGLLAQTSNIGTYSQNEFAVVPELDVKLGYQMTEQLKVSLAFTAIYWSNVVRPGQQIDLDVHPDLLPPSPTFTSGSHPTFAFDTTDYWVQGLSFGGEYRW